MPDNKNNNINPKDDVENLNFDDDSIDIELEDLTLDDGKVDLKIDSVKPAGDVSVNPASSASDASSSEGAASTTGASSDSSTPAQEANSDASAPAASSAPESTAGDNTENEASSEPSGSSSEAPADTSNNQNADNSESQQEAEKARKQEDKNQKDLQNKQNEDNRARNDAKNQRNNLDDNQNDKNNGLNQNNQDKNQNKDNKNNQNNKGNDNKNNNTGSDKKSSPKNGLDKKRDELKDKWNNRPKTPKDFANRAGNGIKNGARNAFNNSKAGQAINRAKNAANKAKQAAQKAKQAAKKVKEAKKVATTIKILLTSKVFLAILLAILVFGMLIFAVSFFVSGSPLVGGEVEDEDNLSKYSEVDQKTIEKLNDLADDYPTGDAALAMVTAVYPYIEELHGGNVNALKANNDPDEYEDEEENTESSDESSQETTTTTEAIKDNTDVEDNENDLTEDDPYLEMFRSWTFRWFKFRKLLKWTTEGEEEYNTHLKEDYFKSDKGYKAMFDGVKDEEALADAIIKDLYNLKDDFQGYFFEICVTNTSYESVGQVEVNSEAYKQMMLGNVIIELLEPGCGNTNSCSTYATLSLEDYVKGVVYEEINARLTMENIEQVKAQMVAVKSYTLSRRTPEQTTDGTYVIKMRWSTADQDYCNYETGCNDVQANYGYNNVGDCLNEDGSDKCKHFSNHGPANEDVKNVLDKAWQETQNYYVLDFDGIPRGSYMASCNIGTCMSQEDMGDVNGDFISILGYFYTDYVVAKQEGEYTSAYAGTTTELCGDDVSGGIPDSEFKFYYQTDYKDTPFCGLDSVAGCKDEGGKNTICTSGCGVTSYAMVIATLSDTEGNFDPIAANNEATSSGSCGVTGTSNNLFTNIGNNHSGFTVEQLPVTKEGANEVLSVLQNGGVVVANVQAKSPFTDGGHWIVIRGLTSDGGVKVADPNSQSITMTEVYDINQFIDENWLVNEETGVTHSWFAIYGPKSEQYKYTAGDGVATGQLSWPIEGKSSTCTDYPYYSNGSYHDGTDIPVGVGTDVLASDGGTVITSKDITKGDCSGGRHCNEGYYSYGRYIEIEHDNGIVTLYGHLSERLVNVGDKVSKGQVIGKSGNTGNSSGPHLHVGVKLNGEIQNPCDYIR